MDYYTIMERQLLRQKVRQIILVMKTNTGVFVVFKTKRELKCQNELFLKYHFSGTPAFMFSLLKLFVDLLT